MYKRWEAPSNKRQLKRAIFLLTKAKTWQLVIILILIGFVTATFLRLNNLGMIERRNAVYKADKEGNTTKIKQSLVDLQHYVTSHMNTSLGEKGIYLEHSYNRDREAAINAAVNSHNAQSDVYQKASIECRARFQGGVASFRNDYVTCVQGVVASLPAEQQGGVYLPSADSYHYNFAPPLVSLDIAGFATVLAVVLSGVIIMRLLLLLTLRLLVKRHKILP